MLAKQLGVIEEYKAAAAAIEATENSAHITPKGYRKKKPP